MTTDSGTRISVITAKGTITDKKDAESGNKTTSPGPMHKDTNIGQNIYVTEEPEREKSAPVFALRSLMTPLIRTPLVGPQLILSSCTVSIAMSNKLFEVMTPGDKIRPRFSWKSNLFMVI
jgi:hypothetical protein